MEMDRMDMKVCKAKNSRDKIAWKEGWKDKSENDSTDINFIISLMIIVIRQMIDTIIFSLLQK